ncbi:MAG TPA: hypothetical protein VGG06_05635 [Thermoanaerobaculia bacterium]|jgi:hypothetical protein
MKILMTLLLILCLCSPLSAAASDVESAETAATAEVVAPVAGETEVEPPADEEQGGICAKPGATNVLEPEPLFASNCSDCDSSMGYCTPGGSPVCRNFCLALVCEIGFCHQECNCCVCPEGSGC